MSDWTHVEWLHCKCKWNLQPVWRNASWWLPQGKQVVMNPSPGIWLFCSLVFWDLGIKLSHEHFDWLSHAEGWVGHWANEHQSLKPHSSYYLPGWPYSLPVPIKYVSHFKHKRISKMSYPAHGCMFGESCKPGLAFRRSEEQQVPLCWLAGFSISLAKGAWEDAAGPCTLLTSDIPG